MSILKTWYEKYRYNTTPAVWDFIALSALMFNEKIYFGDGLQDSPALMKIDRFICPEMFFQGYLELVYHDAAHQFFQESKENIDADEPEWEMNAREKMFFDLASLAQGESSSRFACIKMGADISQEDYKRYLDRILRIYEKRTDNSDGFDEPDLHDRIYNTMQYIKGFVRWKATNGSNKKFCADFEEFLAAPAKEKTWDVIHIGNLIKYCLRYMENNPSENEHIRTFAELTTDYAELRKKIAGEVLCQDAAVRKFLQGLFNGEFRDERYIDSPKSVFLFVGPPGVGKTYLASTAGKYMNRPVKFFQMSEYAGAHSFNGLVGFEATWKNAKPGDLTEYVEGNPNAILIFDEIEKAHANTIHLFLSILEGGVLRDLCTQKDVDFTDTIVIFTTNAGRKFYENKRDIPLSSLPEKTLIDALGDEKYNEPQTKIPTEILSRMAKGSIVGFDHISPAKLIPIIKNGMKLGADIVHEKTGMDVRFDDSMLPYIFLYHMGGSLDARIANARSKAFIIDSFYSLAERMAEDKNELKLVSDPESVITAGFKVESGKLSDELTIPDRKAEFLIVCNQADYNNLIDHKSEDYKLYHVYAENRKDEYKSYILQQVADHEIDAIIIDPYMRGGRKRSAGDKVSGIGHSGTRGMEILEWVETQGGMPPAYCMEIGRGKKTHDIGFSDLQDLRNRGVRDILYFSEMGNKAQRTELLKNFAYELFLERKFDQITSKGKTVDFEMGHVMKSEKNDHNVEIDLCLTDLKLVRGMDAESQEIFIDDEARMRGGFDRIIGADKAKEELRGFVQFLKDPSLFRKSGRQVSRGMLMYGPPGTGKTMLARALACEADCPFISISGSQFVDGSKKVGEIFATARKYAPSVIFIDEIEAIAQNMGNPILKELLTEMDGFSVGDKPVFVIAATNAGEEPDLGQQNIFLDPALLRRFTRKVYMKMPSRRNRIAFVEQKKKDLHGKTYNLDTFTSKDIASFADLTAGKSLAEMENVFIMAIGRAAENGVPVTIDLLTSCFEETIYGEEKKYSPDHLRTTALHEAGHAFVGFECNDGKSNRFIPEYATIIARGGYLGLVRQKIDERLSGYSKQELIKLMRINLAGRASEIVFATEEEGGLTTGASNDLETATIIAESILCRYGMEEGFLPSFSMDTIMKSTLAEKYVDRLNEIMKRELDYTIDLIRKNRDRVEKLADALIDRSRLDTEEMREILGLK